VVSNYVISCLVLFLNACRVKIVSLETGDACQVKFVLAFFFKLFQKLYTIFVNFIRYQAAGDFCVKLEFF